MTRIKLIWHSFIALVIYSHKKGGYIVALKDIITTIMNFDIAFYMTQANVKVLLKYHPDLLNGSLSNPYLATLFNCSRRTRRNILISHYSYIDYRLKDAFYEHAEDDNIMLWEAVIERERLSICISFEKQHHREGDLTLSFQLNSLIIYQMAFTIIPGRLAGCSDPHVLFVGRVQGVRERLREIRRATKLSRDIAPPYLLVAAAQAIALELDVRHVVGVASRVQLSKAQEEGFAFPFDYDSFWKTCSAIETMHSFYVFSATISEKGLNQMGSGHRRRTRLKRTFKRSVYESVRVAFAEQCIRKAMKVSNWY
jgi:uncharacterized protein VirK/YbjX